MIHVLTSSKWAPLVAPVVPGAAIVTMRDELAGGDCLIAFNSGVIVPAAALGHYGRAYNFHAAPPEYPGRDPHHWAAYEGAADYGVTCHVMTARVDAGPIVAVERFPIEGLEPQTIRRYAEARLLALFALWAPRMAAGTVAPNGVEWRGPTRRRRDLEALLDLADVAPPEAARRKRAFAGFPFNGA